MSASSSSAAFPSYRSAASASTSYNTPLEPEQVTASSHPHAAASTSSSHLTRSTSPPSYNATPAALFDQPQPQRPATSLPASSTSTSTSRPAPPRTLSQLPQKKCWICFGEEGEEEQEALVDLGAEAEGGRRRHNKRQEWVHACRCTLVAHSDCLLTWYSTTLTSPTSSHPPRCPVCATPYLISQTPSPFLAFYSALLRRWEKASTAIALGGVLGAGWALAAGYGVITVRQWAGNDAMRWLIWGPNGDGKGRGKYWLNLPLIPLTLLLSRTPLIDSLLPFLPLTLVLSTSSSSPPVFGSLYSSADLASLQFTYPPSPTLLLCLLPWMRWAYLRSRRAVFNTVLAASTSENEEEEAAEEGTWRGFLHSLRRRGGVDDGGDPAPEMQVQLDMEVLPDAPPVADAAEPAPAPEPEPEQLRITTSLHRLTSLLVSTLLFPTACSVAGGGLWYLASLGGSRPSSAFVRTLRRFLGLTAILGGSSATSSSYGWLKSLGASGAARKVPVDPVWLRTTVGGGLLLLVRDIAELSARVAEKRRKASRKIRGYALGGVDWGDGAAPAPEQRPAEAADQGREWSGGRDQRGREARVVVGL